MTEVGPSRWSTWHEQYADPASPLSQRLAVVVDCIRDAVEHLPPGPIQIISVCAGQGHDVVGALRGHARAADVSGCLVEADEVNVAQAAAALEDAGLAGIRAVQADAAELDTYRDMPRADVLLLCGIFGNVSDADVERTIEHASMLSAPGAVVIWTRHRRAPDLTPLIRGWFDAAGYDEVSFDSPGEDSFSVGMNRLRIEPARPEPGVTLFRFLR